MKTGYIVISGEVEADEVFNFEKRIGDKQKLATGYFLSTPTKQGYLGDLSINFNSGKSNPVCQKMQFNQVHITTNFGKIEYTPLHEILDQSSYIQGFFKNNSGETLSIKIYIRVENNS